MNVIHVTPPYDFRPLLALIQQSFDYMDGIIDPPSSIHSLTVNDLENAETILVIEHNNTPIACAICTTKPNALYVGKIAVDEAFRGQGLARKLVEYYETIAQTQKLASLELRTRIELAANHTAFAAMGFIKIAETAHPGYDHPTSITMRKKVTI